MHDYIYKLLRDILPEDLRGMRTIAAPGYLFKTDREGEKLNKQVADVFHHITAQVLYLGKQARLEVHTRV